MAGPLRSAAVYYVQLQRGLYISRTLQNIVLVCKT